MAGTVALIEKYKARLDPQYEFKKVFRALQKLNEIDMTATLLRDTDVGRAVLKLRKEKGLGQFAREIVAKWKKIAAMGIQTANRPGSNVAYSSKVKREPCEYDPATNWNAPSSNGYSTNSYHPARSVKQETIEDEEEYDPSRNWQMEGAQLESNVPAYEPSSSPVRVKREETSPKSKKHKTKDHGSTKTVRESKSDVQVSPVKSAKKTEKHRHPGIKVESVTLSRYVESESMPLMEEIEEYDPSNNYELSNSSPGYYDAESDHGDHEEYQPGPSNVSYQPSTSHDNVRFDEGNDSEASYEEDEPGAYLLHPRKGSNEFSHQSSQESGSEENASDSFVHSTTLYSRNKSVDSEDGTWGSKANIGKENKERNRLSKISSKSKDLVSRKKNEISNSASKAEKHKKPKIKTEKNVESIKTSKTHEKSKKRKLVDGSKNEPSLKKLKPVKVEKSEVREANFLFENLPDVSKSVKKKKKHKTKPIPIQSTVKSENTELKLNLNLPKIQATYRPLPQTESNYLKHKETALTDNQAAELHSKRQTKKMLVYSGGAGGYIPKMMTLFDQCMAILMNNIDAIDSFGGIPFEIVQPILKRCSPEQLYKLEDFNPYLLEDTDPLWKHHCKLEFRSKVPDEMESWREMYLRLSDERERKLTSLTQLISMKEAKKKPLEKKVMLAYVGANAKPPRNVRRAQEKYGTAGRSRPSSNVTSQSTSAIRRDLVDSRMAVPVGSITAASVDREHRTQQIREMKKPRIAPMMAKTLKSISKTRYRR